MTPNLTLQDHALSPELRQRLNQILRKVSKREFLKGHGIGNEIAFHIFDYPPEAELHVRRHIQDLLREIPKEQPGTRVAHVDLLDFLVDYLEDRGLLDKALELQRTQGDEKLLKALRGVLHEEKIAQRFAKTTRPEDHDLVLISGVGSVYPMLRSHTLLNNLHAIMGQTPLVLFYPGQYDGTSLRLFGKSGLVGGAAGQRTKTANYYRAFRLVD